MSNFLKSTLLVIVLSLLAACQTFGTSNEPPPGFITNYADSANHYLDLAAQAPPPEKQSLELKAAGRMLQDHSFVQAQELLARIDMGHMPNEILSEKGLLLANMAALQNDGEGCLNTLHNISYPNQLPLNQKIAYYQLLAIGQSLSRHPLESAEARMALDPLLPNDISRQHNREEIWSTLNQIPTNILTDKIRNTSYGQSLGWLELVYINKQYSHDTLLLNQERRQWQLKYPQHPGNTLFPPKTEYNHSSLSTLSTANNKNVPPRIALLLPMSGALASSGQTIQNGFMAAYKEASSEAIRTYNSTGANIPSLYRQAVSDGATLIVGPLTKPDVEALEKSGAVSVPTLALNFTNDGGKSNNNLYQYALSPQDEAYQTAKKMRSDGYSRVLMLTPEGSWGQSIAAAFKQTFTTMGGTIVDTLAYSGNTDSLDKSIKRFLRVSDKDRNRKKAGDSGDAENTAPVRREDADSIFLVATPQIGRQIRPLLSFYYAGNLPIYATSQIYAGVPNPLRDKDLDGIKFCDTPWMLSQNASIQKARVQLGSTQKNTSAQKARLFAFGLDAYTISSKMVPFSLNAGYLDGTTGKLYLNDHQIYRQLEWAQFKNGVPKHIN